MKYLFLFLLDLICANSAFAEQINCQVTAYRNEDGTNVFPSCKIGASQVQTSNRGTAQFVLTEKSVDVDCGLSFSGRVERIDSMIVLSVEGQSKSNVYSDPVELMPKLGTIGNPFRAQLMGHVDKAIEVLFLECGH